MSLSLPISDPVLIFGLAMGIFLLAPVLFERLRIPGLIGLIVAGALVGPSGLNLLARDFTFVLLGQVGLLYLVFQAGLELDLNRFNEYRSRSLVFGFLSFTFPLLLAVAIMPLLGFGWAGSILIGAIVGSHTLLAYPVASRLGILKNPAMITVVGGTLVTDSLALLVLAVIGGTVQGSGGWGFWFTLLGSLVLYVAVVSFALPKVGRWFFRNVPAQAPAEFIFLMAVLFFVAWGARLAGAEPIIGAFLAGLTLNRLIPLNSPLMTRVRFVGSAIFIPFFLLSVGMLVDPAVLLASPEVWITALALIVLVHLGKLAGALAARWLYGYSREEGYAMFGLSLPQAAATLAVTFVGLEIGLFTETVVNAVIVMIVVTVFVGPFLVERFGRILALQEERRPYDPDEAPRRILIPIANPATADALMDIAFFLRGKNSEEPLYPLTVARGGDTGTEEEVAKAEKMLSHAVLYAAGADVPVSPLTRVDQNIATGVVRAMTETRTTIVVVGWDGRVSASRTAVFGSVLDQILEQSRQTVIVARMGHPLNTTGRIVLILPPVSDRHPGFEEGLSLVKNLAAEVDTRLEAIVVGEDPDRYRTALERTRPEHPFELTGVDGWGPLMWELRTRLGPQDLVILMSARRGTLGWMRELEQVPGQLASLLPESFLVLYPSEVPPRSKARQAQAGLEALPHELVPERMVFGLAEGELRSAMETLLATHFTDPGVRAAIVERLLASEEDFSSEVRSGISLPHALVPGLEEPLLFLGTSGEGVTLPCSSTPARAVFLLLGPSSASTEHLRRLTDLARMLRGARELNALFEATAAETVAEWFSQQTPGSRKGQSA